MSLTRERMQQMRDWLLDEEYLDADDLCRDELTALCDMALRAEASERLAAEMQERCAKAETALAAVVKLIPAERPPARRHASGQGLSC